MTGLITAYFKNRGYGFILCDDGATRFFHLSNCRITPIVGIQVKFTLDEPSRIGKGTQCVDVESVGEVGAA